MLRMQGVSWPSLSCEESLERSLERRRSRERSLPPLAPCRLIFLCWASTRDARAWLLLFKTKAYLTFLSGSQGQKRSLFPQSYDMQTHTFLVDKLKSFTDVTNNTSKYNRKYNNKNSKTSTRTWPTTPLQLFQQSSPDQFNSAYNTLQR